MPKDGLDNVSTVVESNIDTSIDIASSLSVLTYYENNEAYTLHFIETRKEPSKRAEK